MLKSSKASTSFPVQEIGSTVSAGKSQPIKKRKRNFNKSEENPNKKFKITEKGYLKNSRQEPKKNREIPKLDNKGVKHKSKFFGKNSHFKKVGPKQPSIQSHKGGTAISSSEKKPKLFHLKKKERKIIRRKKDHQQFDVSKKMKVLWEELRSSDCDKERKVNILIELLRLVKGRIKEFTFAHDTVRVLECIVQFGNEMQRGALFEELKEEVIPLMKSKYGKFILIKMLHYGSKEHKIFIMNSFHGKVVQLIKHTEAAEVVETAFNECANAAQRIDLLQEFYGSSYKYFKSEESQSLKKILEKNPNQLPSIIKHMKEVILQVLEKSVIKHSIVHSVLWQFMQHCDSNSRSEIIEALRGSVVEILHTKDGSRVGMHCIWHGTTKDRKAIVKSLKPFVQKISTEKHGHMVLLALFDCIDDTKLVEKHIITELIKVIFEVSQNLYGKKVIIYLLSPRDPHYFMPDVVNILKTGDSNPTSKKEVEVRRSEFRLMISSPVLNMIKCNFQQLFSDNSFCLFVLTALKHSEGNREEVFKTIAEVVAEGYTEENKNSHIIENSGSAFLLKHLILNDKHCTKESDISFSETVFCNLPEGAMKSWINCNRGCFLLVTLFETGIPSVVQRIQKEIKSEKKSLSRKSYKGAEILLKKLKE